MCESQGEHWPIRRWSVHHDPPLCSLHSWESSWEDRVSSHPETSSSGRQLCTRESLWKFPRGAWNSNQIKKYVEENSSSSEKQVRKPEIQKQTEARTKASLPQPPTFQPWPLSPTLPWWEGGFWLSVLVAWWMCEESKGSLEAHPSFPGGPPTVRSHQPQHPRLPAA